MKPITINLTMHKTIKDKGRENQTQSFYVVRPTLPMSMPPSSLGLRIPLIKPPRLQELLQLTSHVSINLYNNRSSQISLPQVFPTPTLSQIQDFSHTQSMCLQIYAQGVI